MDMKLGCCTSIDNYQLVVEKGFDYIELAGNQIAAMSDEDFATVCTTIENGAIKCIGFNAALPPTIAIIGPDVDDKKTRDYARLLCARGAKLNIKAIGIGSPKSRVWSDDYDLDSEWDNAKRFVKIFAEEAKPYNINVMWESLNKTESLFGLKLSEALALVKDIGMDNVKIVYDIYHMHMEQESIAELQNVLDEVVHVHIAERVGTQRRYPSEALYDFYAEVFSVLKNYGYTGVVSTEAFDGDIAQGLERTKALINKLENERTIKIGCVADDFTGASDAASFLMAGGLKTILIDGIPAGDFETDCDAIVVALKSRTQKTSDAVSDSLAAFRWLKEQGAAHLYFKYCSTFDSTKTGNIGPVLDSVLEEFNAKHSIISPALPVNKRTVKDGVLYIDDIPLAQTHMKHHPLTPMWASKIEDLISPQGKYQTLNLNYATLQKPAAEIKAMVEAFGADKEHFYVVPDYVNEDNATKVAEVFGDDFVLSGGSGILAALSRKYIQNSTATMINSKTAGKGIVLAGSCSQATLEQIEDYKKKGAVSYKVDPVKVFNNEITVDDVWKFVSDNGDKEVLIYSSDNTENVLNAQKLGRDAISEKLEKLTAEIAVKAVEDRYKRIIIAGGETSSAVTKALAYQSFVIGESIAPGVPIMSPTQNTDLKIVLKSGNFGQVDFFTRALNMTRG